MSSKHELKKLHEDIEKHIEKIKDYKVSYTREKTNLGYKYTVTFDRLLKEENENPTWQKHWDKTENKKKTEKKSTCKTCNKH